MDWGAVVFKACTLLLVIRQILLFAEWTWLSLFAALENVSTFPGRRPAGAGQLLAMIGQAER